MWPLWRGSAVPELESIRAHIPATFQSLSQHVPKICPFVPPSLRNGPLETLREDGGREDQGLMKHDTWACYKPSGRGFSDYHGFFSFGMHVNPGPQVAAIMGRHFVDALWLLVNFNLDQES